MSSYYLRRRGQTASMAVRTSVVHGKVITTSPRRNVGTRTCSTYARKLTALNRAVEYRWRADATQPQGRDHRLRFPTTLGRVVVEAGAAQTPAVAAQQVHGHAALIEKHISTGIV